MDSYFDRTKLVFGESGMSRLSTVKIIIFGIGGVGSWCAEGLIRSGVKHLTIVDADVVSESNINRQLMATSKTIGEVKVDALRDRLLEINPDAEVEAVDVIYNKESAGQFDLSAYDYIVDAIDSLKDKAELIMNACKTEAQFFSSMGAAVKIDPLKIKVAEFWSVRGCPLGSALRKKMKRAKMIPAKEFLCVYDDEVLPNTEALGGQDILFNKAITNGTTAHITAIFGMTLCGLILKDIYYK